MRRAREEGDFDEPDVEEGPARTRPRLSAPARFLGGRLLGPGVDEDGSVSVPAEEYRARVRARALENELAASGAARYDPPPNPELDYGSRFRGDVIAILDHHPGLSPEEAATSAAANIGARAINRLPPALGGGPYEVSGRRLEPSYVWRARQNLNLFHDISGYNEYLLYNYLRTAWTAARRVVERVSSGGFLFNRVVRAGTEGIDNLRLFDSARQFLQDERTAVANASTELGSMILMHQDRTHQALATIGPDARWAGNSRLGAYLHLNEEINATAAEVRRLHLQANHEIDDLLDVLDELQQDAELAILSALQSSESL